MPKKRPLQDRIDETEERLDKLKLEEKIQELRRKVKRRKKR